MKLPEGMSHAARETPKPMDMRALGGLLVFLILLGVIATSASVYAATASRSASQADVERNSVLLERVADLETQNNAEVEEHRVRNEELHADLCRIIYEVVQQVPSLNGKVRPCRPALPS